MLSLRLKFRDDNFFSSLNSYPNTVEIRRHYCTFLSKKYIFCTIRSLIPGVIIIMYSQHRLQACLLCVLLYRTNTLYIVSTTII